MRPSASDDSEVSKAKQQFSATVAHTRKLLVAGGLEAPRASLQLLDQLVQHRLGAVASCSSDDAMADMQIIVAATGFAPAQAARTLLLKEEISHLRSQGHSTADVIQQLDRRLRAATGLRHRADENQLCMPQKKLKLSPESLSKSPGTRPPDAYIWGASAAVCLSEKRPREEVPPSTKAVKLRLSPGDAGCARGAC